MLSSRDSSLTSCSSNLPYIPLPTMFRNASIPVLDQVNGLFLEFSEISPSADPASTTV